MMSKQSPNIDLLTFQRIAPKSFMCCYSLCDVLTKSQSYFNWLLMFMKFFPFCTMNDMEEMKLDQKLEGRKEGRKEDVVQYFANHLHLSLVDICTN
jgi:hypothetical protein